MTGMLQPHDHYRERAARHQQEARDWARANAMGRLARSAREHAPRPTRTHHHHSLRTHLRAMRMHLRAVLLPASVRQHHR